MNKSSESRNGQRIYVWIIVTSTLLLIGLFLWPLSVNQFRTTTIFSLKYDPTSGIEKTSLNSWVVDALREQTNRVAIAEIFAQLDNPMTSSILNSLDPETIRKAIHIQGRPGSSTNSVEYRLSMVGDGSEDEIEFTNAIVSRINHELGLKLTRSNHEKVVGRLTGDFEEFHDNRLQQVSGQLNSVMESLATSEYDMRIVSNDLKNLSSTHSDGHKSVLGRPTSDQLQSLQDEKRRLLNQPGMNEYHPAVVAIRQKIENLTIHTESKEVSSATPGSNTFSGSSNGSAFVKNRFASTTQSIPLDSEPGNETFAAPISDIVQDIELIDLRASRKALGDVQGVLDNLDGTEMLMTRLNERALDELQYSSPVVLSDFQMAKRSAPIGGAPTSNQFMFLLIFSGAFGTIMAMNYDASLRKRPFRSVEQLQRKLSMPVIGVLRNRTVETPRPFGKLAVARILQFCEWTLLALAVLLILAALVNSEVAAAFIENPFHGITRTLWLMSPNH